MSEQDRVALTAPKGIVAIVLTLAAGGGIGATATGWTMSRAEAPVMPWLSKSEVEAVAKSAAETAAMTVREDCRRELTASSANIAATLVRIEAAVHKLPDDTEQLKIDVASIKASKR